MHIEALKHERSMDMKIQRLSLREGSYHARGTAVVIDVFRAFTCESLLYHYGAAGIIIEGDIGRCLSLEGDYFRIGEDNEVPIEGFDLTNSPSLIMAHGEKGGIRGRTVIHRTTSGVTGALAALETADEVLLASFVNAGATAEYIMRKSPEVVSIIAMGIRSEAPAPEDEACSDYIRHLLDGSPYDHVSALESILTHEVAQKFLRGDKAYLPKEDPAICLQRDLFDFALRAEKRDGFVWSERVKISRKPDNSY